MSNRLLVTYDKEGYSGVNFCVLSKLSELSRPAIYSYFKNTDDILLYGLGPDVDDLNNYLDNKFRSCQNLDTEGFTKILHEGFISHPRLLKMISLNYAVMENGASFEALVAYKTKIMKIIALIIRFVDSFFVPIKKEQRTDFIFMLFSYTVSAYVLTNPSQKQIEAILKCDGNFMFPSCEHLCYEGLKSVVSTLKKRM